MKFNQFLCLAQLCDNALLLLQVRKTNFEGKEMLRLGLTFYSPLKKHLQLCEKVYLKIRDSDHYPVILITNLDSKYIPADKAMYLPASSRVACVFQPR